MKKLIFTIILMHIISGTSAFFVTANQSKKIKRNQMVMSILAIALSQLQTIFLATQIKK
jgi:hypothetical protein